MKAKEVLQSVAIAVLAGILAPIAAAVIVALDNKFRGGRNGS